MDDVTVRGAQLYFRNFSGKRTEYNTEGDRNFSVRFNDEQAADLKEKGWNVKSKPARVEGDEDFHHVKIKVKFGVRPPAVWLVTRQGTRKTRLPEELVGMIDWAELENVDLTFRPYKWTMRDGKSGVTAYLRTIFATLREDPLEILYQDVQDVSAIEASMDQIALPEGPTRLALPPGSSDADADYSYDYDGNPE